MNSQLSLFCYPDIDIIELSKISNKVSLSLSSASERKDFPRSLARDIYNYYHSSEELSLLWDISVKENKKRYAQRRRLKARIKEICSFGSPLFLTLTFTDKALSKTSASTRRRYVQDFIKKVTWNGIANIDFGKTYGREHYHCIIASIFDIDFKLWKHGAINCKRILVCNNSFDRLKVYISKLVNHTLKDSVITSRTIFHKKRVELLSSK